MDLPWIQMNIYKSNTYGNGLRWLHFKWAKGLRKAEKVEQAVLYIRLCSSSNISNKQSGALAQILQQYSMQGCTVDL